MYTCSISHASKPAILALQEPKWPWPVAGQISNPTLLAALNTLIGRLTWATLNGREGSAGPVFFLHASMVTQEIISLPHPPWGYKTFVHIAPAARCAGQNDRQIFKITSGPALLCLPLRRAWVRKIRIPGLDPRMLPCPTLVQLPIRLRPYFKQLPSRCGWTRIVSLPTLLPSLWALTDLHRLLVSLEHARCRMPDVQSTGTSR